MVIRDRDDLRGNELAMRLAIPGVDADARLVEEHIRRVFISVRAQEMLLEGGNVLRGKGCAECCHAASRRAFSTRLSIVQMPSIPGRHSLLCRDQRCQVWPAKG